MNLRKFGGVEGGYTLFVDKDGYEHVVVVAKATFEISPDGQCALAERQQPVVEADEHYGDPAISSIRYECDLSLRKPFADVIVNGSAHSTSGRSATEVQVGLAVGPIRKTIRVVGDRIWVRSLSGGYRPSQPQPFTTIPLMYERAFGGADTQDPDPRKHVHETRNLVGVGYFSRERPEVLGTPVPNLEHPDQPVRTCTTRVPPVGFGFVSRNWQPRVSHAGTYDNEWMDQQFPFLPNDFDDTYFQGAPGDQRCPYLQGGESVVLTSMTPENRLKFVVPRLPVSMHLVFFFGHQALEPMVDTLIIEPDDRRCIMVWRASAVLTRKLTDIHEVWVGVPSRARLTALRRQKQYFTWPEERA